ncbi:hypothetical protein JVT61DRAFT_650 [Boletus reticuloceps]|uniref:Uncharacterized protein n=1 Tax=Boletus reticuloceps TaxID=495285 RepID=A0A8I2Z360_9AGAM|nr:hypothetical protein JVT61DRAFT_650 [Boletus reticuloceps]
MYTHSATRVVFCFCITLLTMAALTASSPVPEPEPAPMDPNPASVISSNLNLSCQHGCPAASSAQQFNTNAALGSVVSPLSLFGGLVLSSGILAAI